MGRIGYRAAAGLAVALIFVGSSPAVAKVARDADASSDEHGVDVTITAQDDAYHGVASGRAASSCHWSATPYYDENVSPESSAGPRPGPEYHAYLVFCDGDIVGVYWLGPRNFGLPDVAAMARQVTDHIPVDFATIGVRPTGRAVTGIPSYFWVDGYRGEPIHESVQAFGVTVDVTITLGDVVWDFGDQTPQQHGLGDPWPARSSINHSYRYKGAHTVTVTLTLPASFSVNGGPPTPMPPIVRTATIAYQVDEVQAVRDR